MVLKFLGWFTAKSGGDPVGLNYVPTGGLVDIFAHYKTAPVAVTSVTLKPCDCDTDLSGETKSSYAGSPSRIMLQTSN